MLNNDKNIVDVRGSLCPIPVIETKKIFEKHPGETVITLVDNEVSRDNVEKFAKSKNYAVTINQDGKDYALTMTPEGLRNEMTDFVFSDSAASTQIPIPQEGKVFLLTKDYLGEGSEELGRALMKTFLFSLSEAEVKPAKILMINSAVKMATEGSEHVEVLSDLANAGVEIAACGICLEYFGLKEKVSVGSITNMFVIVEALTQKPTVTL